MSKTRQSRLLWPVIARKISLGVWLLLLGCLIPSQTVAAQTVTVCQSGCDYTTIQAAINGVNNGDSINIVDTLHTEGDIGITKNVILAGQGIESTAIQANASLVTSVHRVFRVFSGATVTFADLTIQHGNVSGPGAGIWNEGGNVTLNSVSIESNKSTAGGSGVANFGTMTLNNSQVMLNEDSAGMTIYNTGTITLNDVEITQNLGTGLLTTGTAVINDSIIQSNSGDGLINNSEGELTVSNTDITENMTGVRNYGQLTMRQSSVYLNGSNGLWAKSGEAQLINMGILKNGGGGLVVLDDAEVVVTDSWIGQNSARGISLTESAQVAIHNTTITNNFTSQEGGGIYVSANGGALSLTHVTVAKNIATASGGGIYVGALTNTPISLTNVTISGNRTDEHGGGIFVEPDGEIELANVTITSNTADYDQAGGGSGGGVYIEFEFVGNPISIRNSGVLRAKNSLIANNMDPTPLSNDGTDCDGDFISAGYNLFGTLGNNALDPACSLSGSSTNLFTMDTKLDLLEDNGGPTETHLPASDSPALDAGDPAGCTDFKAQPIATDQRGTPRIQNGRCDIGAVEGFRIWQDLYLPFVMRN